VLHRPDEVRGVAVLTHGAGSDHRAPLLVALSVALAARGVAVLRCDLPFRQRRASGPPSAGGSATDREGLARAAAFARRHGPGPLWLGGQSYGGRQATLLAAERADVAQGLLLMSYPLHPPRRAHLRRSGHFPSLRAPALFVHGSADPFGTLAELREALALIRVPTELLSVEGAGHDLHRAVRRETLLPARIADAAVRFLP
jgi:predicted alpha/beta-hydrolase family hydrolase